MLKKIQRDLSAILYSRDNKLELFFLLIISIFFFFFFGKLLTGQNIFSHDSIRWYGVYHLFADSLSNGIFPYWDQFDACGQPFYYNLGILQLYNPITLVFILSAKIFHAPLLLTYHWDYVAKVWLAALGVYFCYRQLNKYVLSNLLIFGVFLFSSFTMSAFRQNGILNSFLFTPWVMFFLLRLLKDFKFYNIIGFSLFLGLSLSSYLGVCLLTYLFIFLLTLFINERKTLSNIFKNAKNIFYIFIGIVVIIMLVLPLISVYIEQGKTIPITRIHSDSIINKGIILQYDSIKNGGTHSSLVDFLELLFPAITRGYFWGWFTASPWFSVSEAFLYIGIFPFSIGLIGMFRSKSKYNINFFIALIMIFLLMLGPKALTHHIFYVIFYPLRFARHMHLFCGFFIFTIMYFVGQGLDYILDKLNALK